MKCPKCGYQKPKKINVAKLLKGRKVAMERMRKNHAS
jgi:hypothetical protein